MKKVFVCVLAVLLVMLAVGCGVSPMETQAAATADNAEGYWYSNSKSASAVPAEMPAAEPQAMYENDSALAAPMIPAKRPAKMIYHGELSLETLAFDRAQEELGALVEELDGYFEQKSVGSYGSGYRSSDMTVRVPAAKFDAFLPKAGDLCHVSRMNQSAEDVSEHYYDVDARLTTAKTKLARLQELLAKAENMADIIVIENAIADTEYTIDSLSGTLRNYDSLVDYATVSVYLREVYQYSDTKGAPLTFGERLSSSFREGLRAIGNFFCDLALWLAYSWFWLLVLVGIAVLVIRTAKKKGVRPRRRAKQAESERKNDP